MAVLSTVYIEQETDARLLKEAQRTGLSKGALFRRYLHAGARALRAQLKLGPLPTRPADAPPLMLRTVELDASLAEWIRVQAFDAHVRQSEYVRWCLALGMERQCRM